MPQLQLRTAPLFLASLFAVASAPSSAPRSAVESIAINDNRVAAGTLEGGVLTVRLEAREGQWHPDGDSGQAIMVRAFGETGRPLSIPGPLIRVAEGTEIHAFVRNAIAGKPLTVYGFSERGSSVAPDADTLQIGAGETREVRFTAGAPGTYYYWGTTTPGGMVGRNGIDAELSGAFVVDPRGTKGQPRDRIMVINLWSRDPLPGGLVGASLLLRFTINGKAWPNTERLSYGVGDSVRFRVVNTSAAPHPMHLHGFYFNVDSRGNGTRDSTFDPRSSPHRVVTERIAPGQTAALIGCRSAPATGSSTATTTTTCCAIGRSTETRCRQCRPTPRRWRST